MGDRLVGCASYTMSEFHVRNYMARRPHINQEPNAGTSTAAIMYAAPLNVILAVKPLWRISCLKIFNWSLWDFSSGSETSFKNIILLAAKPLYNYSYVITSFQNTFQSKTYFPGLRDPVFRTIHFLVARSLYIFTCYCHTRTQLDNFKENLGQIF